MNFDPSSILNYASNNPIAVGSLIVLCVGGYLYMSRKMPKSFPRSSLAKPGLVVLHGAGAGSTVVNPSPYVLKLQTFMRMANIEFVHDYKNPVGRKRKMPWIELDGKDYCDSTFIIEFLTEKYNVQIDSHLTDEQRASARVIQKTVEENTTWAAIIYNRWIQDPNYFMEMMKLPWLVSKILKTFVVRAVKKSLYGQGIGRHSAEEIQHIARGDIKALSDLLKDKQFFFGDQPTTIDACVFAFLANVLHGLRKDSWPTVMVNKEFPNLVAYFERIKERVWPDWDEIVSKAGSKK